MPLSTHNRNLTRSGTFSQCNSHSSGVMWSNFLAGKTSRAAAFRTEQSLVVDSDDMDWTLAGREFQTHAAATGNARSLNVDRRVGGTASVDELADLSWRRASDTVQSRLKARNTPNCEAAIFLEHIHLDIPCVKGR